jgi:uncharacterized protein YyaL (SSP411 family)
VAPRRLAASAAFLVLLLAPPAGAGFEDTPVRWRPYGRAAFQEAHDTGRPVFLVLTAPWNWDHFLLPERLFARDEVASRLNDAWVPVLADVSTRPELAAIYSIPSGLVPSFHFLDGRGVPFASFAPMDPEELTFRLDDWRDPKHRPEPEPAEPPATFELNEGKFANRAARYLIDLSARGELPVAAPHRDLDPAPMLFLAEYGRKKLPRLCAETLAREISRLRGGALFDTLDGGFHRAWAAEGRPHFEKLLRPNALMGELLAVQFARTANVGVGRDALLVLRFLNEGLRTGSDPLYAESAAADVYDPGRRELLVEGRAYYAWGAARRRAAGRPPASKVLPVGGNFAALRAFATYVVVFDDARVRAAAAKAGRRLLDEGLEEDGAARAVLGEPGAGNLRDQGDAGRGLLALHGVTGSADALRAARRLAETLVRRFYDSKRRVFRGVADDADAPAIVRDAPPDPAWNGTALRFLAELSATTGEARWRDVARRGIAAWSTRAPADGRGLAELGGAALRVASPAPVLLLAADPSSAEGERLRALACALRDPWMLVRWVAPAEREDVAARFHARIEPEPALYLVWGRPSGALRDADALRAVYEEAAAHAPE